jgi:hypothetical protein
VGPHAVIDQAHPDHEALVVAPQRLARRSSCGWPTTVVVVLPPLTPSAVIDEVITEPLGTAPEGLTVIGTEPDPVGSTSTEQVRVCPSVLIVPPPAPVHWAVFEASNRISGDAVSVCTKVIDWPEAAE